MDGISPSSFERPRQGSAYALIASGPDADFRHARRGELSRMRLLFMLGAVFCAVNR